MWTLHKTHLTAVNEKCTKNMYKMFVVEPCLVTNINPFQQQGCPKFFLMHYFNRFICY